jgi:GT2 family glycosyltransferase
VTAAEHTVGVVFVNFHCEDDIDARADRFAPLGHPVVVVDNSGTYTGAHPVVRPGENVGFGAACNRGVAALPSSATAVCLHNPDVDLAPDDLMRLHEALLTQPRPGLVAPALQTGAVIRTAGYRYPNPFRELALAARAARAPVPAPGGPQREGHQTEARRTGGRGRRFGTAALLVAHRAAFSSVGGFDERLFLYGEDLDLWHRMVVAGRSTGFETDVVAGHARGQGSPMARPTRELLRWVAIERFAETFHGRRWRWYRRAHRPFLGRLAAEPRLVAEVAQAWDRGLTPEAVLEHLGRGLRDGTLVAVPAS